MRPQDKRKFIEELTLTIQCVQGTIRPPHTMLNAYFEILRDLPLESLLSAMHDLRRNGSGWPSPRVIRAEIEGTPALDAFADYMDNYVARGQAAAYRHPTGLRVIRELGGSRIFADSTTFARRDLEKRWVRTWAEIQKDG